MLRVVAVLFAAGVAMSLRIQTELVSWSADGTAALLRTATDGPEGGSELSYRVVDLARGQELTATVADTLSDGSGPTDHLDRAACRSELEKLAPVLAGFRDVSVDPKGCSLSVKKAAPGEELSVESSGGQALIKKSGATVAHAWRESVTNLRAFASPNGRAMLLIDTRALAPVRGAWLGPGKLANLQPVKKQP